MLEVATEALEDIRADVVVVAFFDSDRPLRGAAGRADWRLCGRISRLLLSGKLSGAAGEAVLLATGPGWVAPRVLGLGLGSRREFDGRDCEGLARDAVGRALLLRAKTMALPVCDPGSGRLGIRERVGAMLRGAVSAVAAGSVGLRLQLVVPESDATRAREAATEFAARSSQIPIAFELGAARGVGTPPRSPHGGAGEGHRGTQIFK